jgi:2-amino-4-hydroxy-6-hydroxymethyldihydropteridine diphosphokinase
VGRVVTVAVALGSNLGDRRAHLDYGVTRLRGLLEHLKASQYRDTEPFGVPGHQPLYLNAAAVGETTRSARDLLEALLEIEQQRGRTRPYATAPRTLDLDLVLFGEESIDEPGLIVPHPRFRGRRFVLEPLAEIAPALRDPTSRLTIAELLERLR